MQHALPGRVTKGSAFPVRHAPVQITKTLRIVDELRWETNRILLSSFDVRTNGLIPSSNGWRPSSHFVCGVLLLSHSVNFDRISATVSLSPPPMRFLFCSSDSSCAFRRTFGFSLTTLPTSKTVRRSLQQRTLHLSYSEHTGVGLVTVRDRT